MPRMLSYADAVRLLGGRDNPLVAALDQVSRGLLLGAVPTLPALLGWLDARGEFVRVCQDLVRGVSDRRTGLHRLDRNQRLAAAHTVIVVLGYFDALDAVGLPFRLEEAELTREEQLSIARQNRPSRSAQGFVAAVLAAGEVIPEPHGSDADFTDRLGAYYRDLSLAVASSSRDCRCVTGSRTRHGTGSPVSSTKWRRLPSIATAS